MRQPSTISQNDGVPMTHAFVLCCGLRSLTTSLQRTHVRVYSLMSVERRHAGRVAVVSVVDFVVVVDDVVVVTCCCWCCCCS